VKARKINLKVKILSFIDKSNQRKRLLLLQAEIIGSKEEQDTRGDSPRATH